MNKGQHWINPQPWLSRVFWATTWKKNKTHQIASPRIWVNMLNINVRKHAWTIGGFVFRVSALQHAPGPAPCFTVGLPGGSGSPVLLQLQRLWLPFPSHPAGNGWPERAWLINGGKNPKLIGVPSVQKKTWNKPSIFFVFRIRGFYFWKMFEFYKRIHQLWDLPGVFSFQGMYKLDDILILGHHKVCSRNAHHIPMNTKHLFLVYNMLQQTNMYIYICILYMYHLCVKTKHFASHGTSWVFSGPLERKKTQFLARHWPLCLFWTSAFLNRFQWFRIKQQSHWNTFVISTWHQKKTNFVFTITVFITTKTNNRTPPAMFQLNEEKNDGFQRLPVPLLHLHS